MGGQQRGLEILMDQGKKEPFTQKSSAWNGKLDVGQHVLEAKLMHVDLVFLHLLRDCAGDECPSDRLSGGIDIAYGELLGSHGFHKLFIGVIVRRDLFGVRVLNNTPGLGEWGAAVKTEHDLQLVLL